MTNPTSRRRWALVRWTLVLLLFALLGSGCVGVGRDAGAGGEGEASTAEGGTAEDAGGDSPAAPGQRALTAPADEEADGDFSADDAGGALVETAAVRQRAVISTGTVTLREADLEATRIQVRKVIDTYAGTIAEQESDTDDEGNLSMARLVVRVPSLRFQAVMDELGALSERPSVTTTSEDVTTQVIDVQARVRAQTASLERVEALLARAEDLRDIVAIESQLTRRQADLDSLRSQQAWLADQSSLSTVAIYLEKHEAGQPSEDDDSGFLAGLTAGWKGLGQAFSAGATVLGAVLPFALVLLLVGWPTYLLARRVVRRRGVAPFAPQPAAATAMNGPMGPAQEPSSGS